MDRRRFLALSSATLAPGCAANTLAVPPEAATGRLRARPGASKPPSSAAPGEHPLGLGDGRDGLLIVPKDLRAEAPLALLLHGAGGSARGVTSRLDAAALGERFRTVILAVDSRGRTWDAIRGSFGPDVGFLDAALTRVFERVAIDRKRVAVAGFSDGATYGLSLGLINGDLFTHVMAFSPGFLIGGDVRGKPAIFVSHGTRDEILPIDRTSRRLAPALRESGYAVDYREFDGPHTVPSAIVDAAFTWMTPPR